jgi:hypothetical protein
MRVSPSTRAESLSAIIVFPSHAQSPAMPQELSRLDVSAQRFVDLSEHLRKYVGRTGHARTDPHGSLAGNPYSCQCAGPPSSLGRPQQDSPAGSIYSNNPNIETFHEVKQRRSMEGKESHPLRDRRRSRYLSSSARSLSETRLFLHRATIIVSGMSLRALWFKYVLATSHGDQGLLQSAARWLST